MVAYTIVQSKEQSGVSGFVKGQSKVVGYLLQQTEVNNLTAPLHQPFEDSVGWFFFGQCFQEPDVFDYDANLIPLIRKYGSLSFLILSNSA